MNWFYRFYIFGSSRSWSRSHPEEGGRLCNHFLKVWFLPCGRLPTRLLPDGQLPESLLGLGWAYDQPLQADRHSPACTFHIDWCVLQGSASFDPHFVIDPCHLGPLTNRLKYFQTLFQFRRGIRNFKKLSGVRHTAESNAHRRVRIENFAGCS